MTITELALALSIQRTNPKVDEPTSRKYAALVIEQASSHDLDPWLFDAIIFRESRWTADAVNHEKNGTCSVGLGQINGPCSAAFIASMSDPVANIHRMGYFLGLLHDRCKRSCDNIGWLRGYNADSHYLAAVRAMVQKHHAEAAESSVLQVPPDVHVSWMQGKAGGRAGRECWLDTRSSPL